MARAVKRGDKYVLEINEEEAKALRLLFNATGGDPHKTLRGEVDKMSSALSLAGMSEYMDFEGVSMTGCPWFTEKSKGKL